ncbi:MAG: hypothetical protein IT332_09065, partial [Ardenticatenales bacterium]|nr:hypothetical protein [Ardenticatenales bacterium]
MTQAGTASAEIIGPQQPCGTNIVTVPFNTVGGPIADFYGQAGTCFENQGWDTPYRAFDFVVVGNGHTIIADTCGNGSGDTEVAIYQLPNGGPNPFNPNLTCANRIAWDDDFCSPRSQATAPTSVAGNYTITVNTWFNQGTSNGNLRVQVPTCVFPPYPFFEEIPYAVTNPLELCATGRATIALTLTNVGDGALDNFGSAHEFYVDVVGAGGPAVIVGISSGSGGGGSAPALLPGPNCELQSGASVHVSIPPGGTDTVTISVAFPQGLPAGLSVNRSVFYDNNNSGGCDDGDARFQYFDELPVLLPCADTVWPNDQLGKQVHLPILNFQGQDDVCESWIEVQNLGCRIAKAALVTWGEPGFCPP